MEEKNKLPILQLKVPISVLNQKSEMKLNLRMRSITLSFSTLLAIWRYLTYVEEGEILMKLGQEKKSSIATKCDHHVSRVKC
jgi:hypothetical protein